MKASISTLALVLSLATACATAGAPAGNDGLIGIDSVTGVTSKCLVVGDGSGSYASVCNALTPDFGYLVTFQIFTPTGTVPAAGQYSYQWTVPAANGQAIDSGCTASQSFCSLQITPNGATQHNSVSTIVTEVSTGLNITVSSRYFIQATCFGPLQFC